ncbi:FAD-binding protein [Pikeienuella sp. HZG-20]|uniref:FAD-binding protein n=1 Tax=Paludibacillus litoralis TaxID=3133267 RepID=UPI0030ECC5FD
MTSLETDVLVLGGGVSGRRAAIAAARRGANVVIAYYARGASPYLLGCNAAYSGENSADSPRHHAEDTIQGGYRINDVDLVERLAHGAPAAIRDVSDMGVPFAARNGEPALRHLSGNRHPRSWFVAEGTGVAIIQALARTGRALGLRELKATKALTLLRDGEEVTGAIVVDSAGRLISVRARAVVVALGGLGRAYGDSTYPPDVGSTSYGVLLRAGARLIDMEFVQFEPTVTVFPAKCAGMEMPTAMLGDGAFLRNVDGHRFMLDYNPDGGERRIEKARLSLCIQKEIDEGRGFPDKTVEFDCTALPADVLEGYVTHRQRLLNAGVDPAVVSPRVRPAAHSMMGGARIDSDAWTGVPGLYAGGEAAGGVHGASRLAGNGGADILVFGGIAGDAAARDLPRARDRDWLSIERRALDEVTDIARLGEGALRPAEVAETIRRALSENVGIYRDADGLGVATRTLDQIASALAGQPAAANPDELVEAVSAADLLLTARVVSKAATLRTESRGAHQRRDHPERDDEHWRKHIAFRLSSTGELAHEPCPVRSSQPQQTGGNTRCENH